MNKYALVVEDDLHLRNLFAKALRSMNFEVQAAADGMEALLQLGLHLPNLVLLDVSLPEMGGLEILKFIRQSQGKTFPSTHPIHVIVVTGNHLAQNSPEAQLADLFLLKPVSMHELSTLIQRLYPHTKAD